MDTKKIGQRVKQLRLEQKLTQQQLAARSGLSLREIEKIEIDADVTLGQVFWLWRGLGQKTGFVDWVDSLTK